MIPLRLSAVAQGAFEPFVVRLNRDVGLRSTRYDCFLTDIQGDMLRYEGDGWAIDISGASDEDLDGDVLLVNPRRGSASRLIRAASGHNTLLVTERCDQLCVMCSQPPKKHHVDLFDHLELACQLAPRDAVIGISGGEPTLFKSRLFDMLRRLVSERSDLRFHVLTNGQHFLPSDIDELGNPAVTWGIPLYSFKAERHDQIVGKTGAFETLMQTFVMLARAGATVELRTVVTSKNVDDLPLLGRMIVSHLPFIHRWAIMQLENIGFARRDWATLFCDTSVNFEPIAMAMNLARARGIRADLFNFPLCTIPSEYRSFAPSTISDWKKKYLPQCSDCTVRQACGGFFEWHPQHPSFARISAI